MCLIRNSVKTLEKFSLAAVSEQNQIIVLYPRPNLSLLKTIPGRRFICFWHFFLYNTSTRCLSIIYLILDKWGRTLVVLLRPSVYAQFQV